MKLSKDDVKLFYRLYHSLWIHANKKRNILNGLDSVSDIKKFSIKELDKIRQTIYKNPELIESFIQENQTKFSSDELEIIKNWKYFLKDAFYVVKYLKEYTVFLVFDKNPKIYGVYALNSSFQEMMGQYLPVMTETVLLPFKNKIIYDSLFSSYNISFGGGIKKSLNNAYQEAKIKHGIITTLPFLEKGKMDELTMLKTYLSTKDNIAQYRDEINKLIKKDPELLKFYYQEIGRINSRFHKRQLKELGIKNAWFAILFDTIIASGKTKESLEKTIKEVLPEDRIRHVHIFQA